MLPHLPVGVGHNGLRRQSRNPVRYLLNICNPVVYIIHLSASGHLPSDGLPNHLLVVFHYIGLNRHSVYRRLFQNAHVPYSGQTHMQGPGNRRGSQRQDVHIFLQLLNLFFVGYAEALFLVNNQQSQVFKFQVLGKYPVGSDDNIHHALSQPLQGPLLLGRRAETAEHIHPHREILHPLDKGIVVLLGQNGGRHQIYHLLAVLNRLKGRPQGHLRFSVAHIAANQPVHNLFALHIRLYGFDGIQLVLRLLIGKQLLKFLLPHRIRPVLKAVFLLSGGIELYQVLRNLLNRSSHPAFGFGPLAASKLI